MYYAPIDSPEYQQLYPEIKSIPKNTEVKTSLQDYLMAYGFLIHDSLLYYEEKPSPEALMNKILKTKHPGKVKEITEALDEENTKESKSYLSGEWFELYCYKFFKNAFQLKDNQIACSVKIKRLGSDSQHENDNEVDLMFVHQNDLYVMECKVYKSDKIRAEKFTRPMYKLASLSQSKNFGLKSKKYLAVLCNKPKDPKAISQIENAVQTLGIDKILDIEAFANYTGKDILRVDQEFKVAQLLKKFND
uniref:Card1-like endonuclease domain-containing protein n=1 Tax=Algoriphagus formosus TaxID=2007308 RepID=UPI003742A73B